MKKKKYVLRTGTISFRHSHTWPGAGSFDGPMSIPGCVRWVKGKPLACPKKKPTKKKGR